jgi:hypothetical protein
MKNRNVAAVTLVIVLGLACGALGLLASDLYTVAVLVLFIGGVGVAVLVGDYLIRRMSIRRPPA